eukprot:g904.t1
MSRENRRVEQDSTVSSSALGLSFPSPLQRERLSYVPILPTILKDPSKATVAFGEKTSAAGDVQSIRKIFPNLFGQKSVYIVGKRDGASSDKETTNRPSVRIGVVLSGGQAPGGHNVITGLYDFVQAYGDPESSAVFGFKDGPKGVMTGKYVKLTDGVVDRYRNLGGFDMIGSGRDKIHSDAQFAASLRHCEALRLDGLVVIGGDDSNTNACLLAEYFKQKKSSVKCVGCPKTIDNDLKNDLVPVSFGFDTACKVYSEQIGSVCIDAASSAKKWHICRLMGRSASHITLECALRTHPNCCFVGEEIQAKKHTLKDVTDQFVDIVLKRKRANKPYGVALLPEGMIEFIPEIGRLIQEINDILGESGGSEGGRKLGVDDVAAKLSTSARKTFDYLPKEIASSLMLDRDSHGNVKVSQIETERLLVSCALDELRRRKEASGFKYQFHFFGYEGRSAMPSNFDANYCYALGTTAATLLVNGCTGLIAAVSNLDASNPADWTCGGVPLTSLMNMERRAGKAKPVIRKALTNLNGLPFLELAANRDRWALEDAYIAPGPIQFNTSNSHAISRTLELELEGLRRERNVQEREKKRRKHDGVAKKKESDGKICLEVSDGNGLSSRGVRNPLSPASASSLSRERAAVASASVLPSSALGGDSKTTVAAMDTDESPATSRVPSHVTATIPSSKFAVLSSVFPQTCRSAEQVILDLSESRALESAGLNVGVVFCGRPSPAGHAILHGLVTCGEVKKVFGFVDGTNGLYERRYVVLDAATTAAFRNEGGYDLLGRSRDVTGRDEEQLEKIRATVESCRLDGLVLIGGTHTASDSAVVTEYFNAKKVCCSVVFVPATVDGDLRSPYLDVPCGFDTSSRVMAQLVGNLARDAASAKKYYYFVRLMGRAPSHLAVEVALQTNPDAVVLGERVRDLSMTLKDVVNELADTISERFKRGGKNYGIVLVPEGLITFVPEISGLLKSLHRVGGDVERLDTWHRALFDSLPSYVREQFLLKREVHGTLQLSQIETEKMLRDLVAAELGRRKRAGNYDGTFKTVCTFLAYQVRCSFPTPFDSKYGAALGDAAGKCVASEAMKRKARGICGELPLVPYAVGIRGLRSKRWKPVGVPTMLLMKCDARYRTAEVPSSAVDTQSRPYQLLLQRMSQKRGGNDDGYSNPGPIQMVGTTISTVATSIRTLDEDYLGDVASVTKALRDIERRIRPGLVFPAQLAVAKVQCNAVLAALTALQGKGTCGSF